MRARAPRGRERVVIASKSRPVVEAGRFGAGDPHRVVGHRYRRASRGWTTPREVGCGPWRRFGEDDSCDLPETAHVRLPFRSEGDANKKYPLARSHCAGKKARRPRGSPETTLEARLMWATRERSRAAST